MLAAFSMRLGVQVMPRPPRYTAAFAGIRYLRRNTLGPRIARFLGIPMKKITEQEFLHRLETLDEETLQFMASYAAERRKLIKVSTLISTVLASIAGLVLAVSYIFPGINDVLIAVGSTVIGAAVGALGIWERKREEIRLLSRLVSESRIGESSTDSGRKRELIERFLKAEGL